MRTLAVTQNITLDGRIEMLGDWFDDQLQGTAGNDDLMAENRRQDDACDTVLLGRDTFVSFRGYWADLPGDSTGISDYLNGVEKVVVSSTLGDPQWQHSTVLTGDLVAGVQTLKDQEGGDIVCTGSIRLTHALFEAGLVDEIRLFTYPVVQGEGRRLFPDGLTADGFRCVEAKAFDAGLGYQRWARA